jgi:RNA polymerase sigma factor (sigma-70 family)
VSVNRLERYFCDQPPARHSGDRKRNETQPQNDRPDVSDVDTDPTAEIEHVYRRERAALVRLAFLLVGSRELAEDIVHTAFVQTQTRWASIERPGPSLRQVVVNQAKEAHRRAYRELAAGPEPVTDIPEIDETWDQILRLTPSQRAVVVLRFYEDLALTEIAEILDRPPSTVRSDLRRAIDRLRRTLP